MVLDSAVCKLALNSSSLNTRVCAHTHVIKKGRVLKLLHSKGGYYIKGRKVKAKDKV